MELFCSFSVGKAVGKLQKAGMEGGKAAQINELL